MNRSQQIQMKPARRHRRREGSLTLQIVLVLPILIIVTIAIIQIGFLVTLRQAVHHAATVAAREAAKDADIDHVVCVVNSILRPHRLCVGDCVGVVLEDPAATDPVVEEGMPCCAAPTTPVLDGNEVRVTVCASFTQRPLGGMLTPFGICTGGKAFRASSVAQKEVPP